MCINIDLYYECLDILKNHKVIKTRNRPNASGVAKLVQWGRNKGTNKYDKVGFPCESQNFGMVIKRFCNNGNPAIKFDSKFQEASNNEKYPVVYNMLKKLIHEIDPNFEYNSITLNHNFKCEPHYDKNNKTPSLIIGLGDYKGGELVVEGVDFDIQCNPLVFNGGFLKHWTNDFIGDRYTIVYYKI